ncbi:MAG TPA: hypothetical protein VNC78_03365 [Actinomycetota bacterium]|nr:hypothetical protein [Actinomycetota bacterium]
MSVTAAPPALRGVNEWGVDRFKDHTRTIGFVAFVVFYLPYFTAIEAIWLTTNAFWSAGFAAVYLILSSAWISTRGRAALRALRVRAADPDVEPRLFNLVEGIAMRTGVMPQLWVIPEGGPNAFVCHAKRPALAITQSLLDTYRRTELEAVVAHCLLRLEPRMLRATREYATLGPFAPRVELVGGADDLAAVALTRYPPALASAIDNAEARTGRSSAYWFVAESRSHRPVADRLDELRDL